MRYLHSEAVGNLKIRHTKSFSKYTITMKFTKLIKGLFIFLLLLIVLAVAIPYFFQDEIKEKIKADISNHINGKVEFSDVSLSLFKNFPNFSFQMDDFELVGIEEFEGVSLVNADEVGFSLDLMSVFNSESPIQINSVSLIKPDINIIVLENGKSNYDIAKTDPEATTSETDYNFVIQLQKYLIQEGNFTYDDRMGNIFVDMANINHNGKGDFTEEVFDLVTKTNIEKITARSGGVQYINRAKGELDITLHSDLPNMKFTLKENELQINDLALKADGWLELKGDDINMDFNFDAPSNTFKSFLSLIPNAYTKDFANLKTDGKLKLDGFVKGTYNEKSIPAFDLNLDVKDAWFQYPDLPMAVKDIFAKASIKSPNSDLDKMVIDISQFKMLLGSNPFEGKLKLKTPMSDPDIDTEIKGNINFVELANAFPLEGVESLTGTMKADLKMDARMSSIERGDYQNVDMKGIFQLNKFSYKSKDMPPVLIEELAMNFTPQKVDITKFLSKLGKSDLRATGSIDNILAYISPKQTMKGKLEVRSNYFDVNEWMSNSTASETASAPPELSEPVAVFDRFDFDLDAKLNNVDYDVYEMKNMELRGNATSSKISIQKFAMDIGDSDIKATGNITNVFDYLYKNETLNGDIAITSNLLDLNQFMVEVPEANGEVKAKKIADTEAAGPILIPDNIKMNIDANIRKVRYTDLDLKHLKGRIAVEENKAELQNCVASIFGGEMAMDGKYDTADPKKPAFDLKYQIKQWDFQNAFEQLNTFKSIAPIGKFITGKFNSNLEVFGFLGSDMYPDLSSLTADGFLQTIKGAITKFEPLQKLSNQLNINALKNMEIKDTKNWFELKDGRMNLQEFNYEYDGIDMLVSGSHGIDTDMDYKILAKIPRKLWENNAAGKAAGKGLDFLKGEAGKLGVNLDLGDFVDVQINILGTMADPKIKIKPLGSGGKSLKDTAKDVVDQVVTKAKEEVKEKVEDVKKEVIEKVDNKKAELKAKADAEYKKIMATATANANKIKAEAAKLSDKTTKEGYKQAENLIDEAGSNPLKKLAAKKAADVLKKQTDKKADQIVSEGDKRAEQLLDKAKKSAEAARKRILGG